jgi:hypothetical protein
MTSVKQYPDTGASKRSNILKQPADQIPWPRRFLLAIFELHGAGRRYGRARTQENTNQGYVQGLPELWCNTDL